MDALVWDKERMLCRFRLLVVTPVVLWMSISQWKELLPSFFYLAASALAYSLACCWLVSKRSRPYLTWVFRALDTLLISLTVYYLGPQNRDLHYLYLLVGIAAAFEYGLLGSMVAMGLIIAGHMPEMFGPSQLPSFFNHILFTFLVLFFIGWLAEGERRNLSHLFRLRDICNIKSSMTDMQTTLAQLVERTAQVLDAQMCGVLLLDACRQELRLHHPAFGMPPGQDIRLPLSGGGVCVQALLTGQGQLVEEAAESPVTIKGLVTQYNVRSVIAIPLKAEGDGFGVLLLCTTWDGKAFSSRDLMLASILAEEMGIVLRNAKLYWDLRKNYRDVVRALSMTVEAKDPYTHGHSERVTRYALAIGESMGLSPAQLRVLENAGYLHDIGKIGIRWNILNKPGRLSPEEYEMVKQHPDLGYEIVSTIENFQEEAGIIRHHHERYDGKGYPLGLTGEDIPLGSRIMAVADAFDAMISRRPYRQPLSWEAAVKEIKDCQGFQFDPRVVAVFLEVVGKLREIQGDNLDHGSTG